MSVSMTLDAVRARQKTVTRRHVDSWRNLKTGDRLTLIEKGMGLPKGAKQVVVCDVEIVDVRVEPLGMVTAAEVAREGLGRPATEAVAAGEADTMADWFIKFWCAGHGYRGLTPEQEGDVECRRIEWRYLTDVDESAAKTTRPEKLPCCGTRRTRPGVTHVCAMPTPPRGFAACRTHDGTQTLFASGATRQITHLVQLDEAGSNGGRPTVCGLTRFDARDGAGQVTSRADLPGWSMGGGVSGPDVQQVRCSSCWPAE